MQRVRQSLPISPNSRLVLVLDLVLLTVVVCSFMSVCYQAAFHSSLRWLLGLFYFCDVVYFLGVCSRFFVGYKDRGVVVRSVKKNALRLLKSTFAIDTLSLLPLELLALAVGDATDIDAFTVAALLRLNRMLRCYRLFLFFNQREAGLGVNTPLLRAFRFGLIAVMSIHLQTCIWYAMACPNLNKGPQAQCIPGTWANYHQFNPELNVSAAQGQWDKYILSLYWSIATVTVTGYGDIHPITIGEKWFSIITMIWGITMFGYILGGLASMLTNSDVMLARYKHRLMTIKEHLVETCKEESLRKRVIGYYEYLWMRSKGNCNRSLFDELPRSFQAEVSLGTYKTMMEQTPVLRNTSSGFRRMLSLVVRPMLCLPSQVIVRKGETGHKMFFIQKGLVEILDGATRVGTLTDGNVFGEVNLVYSEVHSATVCAVTHCDILTLSRADLTQVSNAYPADALLLKEEIRERCETAFRDTEHSTMSIEEEHLPVVSDDKVAFGANDHQNTQGIRSKWSSLATFTVTPGSKVYYLWSFLVSVLALLTTWITCYVAGFGRFTVSTAFNSRVGGILMLSVLYAIDAFCVLDIVVSSRTATFTPYGLIKSTPAMAIRYLKSYGFFLDLMAVLPLEVFALVWSSTEERWSYFALLRLNRLLKLWKVYRMFNQLENDVNMPIGSTRAVKLLVSILTLVHVVACIWLPLACFRQESCLSNSWAAFHGVSTNTSAFSDYLISLYWAATTMTSTGYGEITAHTGSERTFSLMAMITGLLMFGYTLGLIAATLTNSASVRVSLIERMVAVHQFMKDHKLGKGLLKRVDHYFELLWHQSKGEYIPGGQFLMHDMPRILMEEVKMAECQEMWDNVPFFSDVDPQFLRCLALKTSAYLFAPGDYILYYGDMGREMYCIRKGNVEILSEDLSQVVALLGPGDYFGEMGLLFGVPRTATVRAATHCEVNMIPKSELDSVLEVFPIVKKHFSIITKDKSHMKVACAAAAKSSYTSMQHPRQFEQPCILTGMAVAMGPLIAPITRTPITPTIAACLGDEQSKLKVSCPMSFGQLPRRPFLKYQKADEQLDQSLAKEEEDDLEQRKVPSTGRTETALRQRKKKGSVIPVSSSYFMREQEQDCKDENKDQKTSNYVAWRRCRRALDRVFSFFLMRYTFLPTSRACAVWEFVVSVAAYLSLITVSLQAAFFHFHPVIWTINYILDAVFLVDMFLKFHTGYYTSDGMLITQPIACAKHYIKTNFALDLLAGFPLELVAIAAWRPINTALRVLSLVRINRILRTYRLPLGFSYLEEKITNTSGLITEIKFAVYMLIGTHWTACLWYFIACPSIYMAGWESHTCGEDTWAYRYANYTGTPLSNQSLAYQYVVSLYWAVSTTANVGYGDIFAYTDLERVFSLLVMTCGIVGYGYIIASVAASLANADSTRARFQERLTAIKSYMVDQGLGSLLRTRVVNYYDYIWKRNKGVSFESLFQGMPVSLQADMSLSLYKRIIDQVPLFQNTEIGFTKLLALSIKPVLFLKNEYIVRKGDIGSEMFFINRGTVEVVSEDGNVVFASMTEGKFFGEISLMFSVPRTASIRAATNCDLFMLTKKDLDEALSYYPEIAEQIKAVAGNRADKVKKRAQIAQQAKSEGKSAGDAAAAAAKGTSDMEDEGEKRAKATSRAGREQSTDEGGQSMLDDLLEIEEDAPPPVSKCSQCLNSCLDALRTKCWPFLKLVLTFTIPEDSRFNTAFSILSTLLAYISVLTLSFQSVFQVDEPVFFVINYTFDAYFIIEMLLKFHVTYEDHQGRTVSDFKLTALHYIKQPTGFLMDAIASFPFEIFALPIPDPKLRIGVLLYLRVTHILRLDRVQHFISTEGKKLNQKTVVTRLLTFIVLISLCTQAAACVWYMLACQLQECKAGTWAVKANMYGTPFNPYIHYTNSLYWAVATMTSTGYGELTPTTPLELLFASGVMVVGKLLFGFILGSIASTLANLETQKVQFEEKLSAIKGYMKEQNLASALQNRVLSYFEYLWMRSKGVDQTCLFQDMPHCMQADVSLSVMEELLKKVPVFQDSETAFLRHLSLTAKPLIFLPGEYIVRKGDIGYGLFLICSGKVEVLDDSGSVLAVLGEGQYIGQRTMVYNEARTTSMRASTHVDVFLVMRTDYEKVVEHHPSVEEQVRCTAEELYHIPVKKERRLSEVVQ